MEKYFETVKAHYKYSPRETREILLATALVAFMFAFDDGQEIFELMHWVFNYLLHFVMVLAAFLIMTTAQKLWGIAIGYMVRFKIWSYGLALGIAVAVLSGGKLIIPLPGGVSFGYIPRLRLGGFRIGLKHALIGWISGFGPLVCILAAMTVKFLLFQVFGLSGQALDVFIYVNFMLAFFMLLPIPPLPGIAMFHGNRLLYVIVFGFILAYMLLFMMHIYSFFLALIIAVAIWVSYYILVEHKA